jgi:hypothetical protein
VEIEDVKEVGGTSTQPKTSKQLKISLTLLLTLRSWNLDQLCLRNPILSIGKCTSMERSPKVSSPRNLSSIWTEQVSSVRPQLKSHLLFTCTIKTFVNLFSQLHQQLEEGTILVRDIPKMDTPMEFVFGGNLA